MKKRKNGLSLYEISISVILFMITIFFAGLSSEIMFGLRLIDFILIFSICLFLVFGDGIKYSDISVILGLIVLIVIGFIIGLNEDNPFVLSDLRKYVSILLGFVLVSQINSRINYEVIKYAYYLTVPTVFVIYLLASQYSFVQGFYIPLERIEGTKLADTRVFGPSLALVTYLYVLLFYTKKQSYLFHFIFVVFAFLIYFFLGTRHVFVMMVIVFIVGILFDYGILKSIAILVPVVFFVFAYVINEDQRLLRVVDPFTDSSFMYRVISNGVFFDEYIYNDIKTILLGYGFGSMREVWMGGYIGLVQMVILDNGVLTIIMKSGALGLCLFCFFVVKSLYVVHKKYWFGLIVPLIVSSLLSAHIVTHFIYLFGFFLSVKYLDGNENE